MTPSVKMSPPVSSRFCCMRSALHDQAVDEAGRAAQHEVGEPGGVRADDALDRRVRDVALVPQRHVLQRRLA